jgi:nitrogen-specific signal transduction histidine kinase
MTLRPIAFAPLHRTAVRNSGMGLGLSMCRSIIEAHDGQARAESSWPREEIFNFIVPSHQKDAL